MNKCLHSSRRLELTPHLQHHGKELCVDCGRFLGWVKKPETIEREAQNAKRLVKLRGLELPAWEKAFIASLEGQGPKVSPKQQEILDRIFTQYGQ